MVIELYIHAERCSVAEYTYLQRCRVAERQADCSNLAVAHFQVCYAPAFVELLVIELYIYHYRVVHLLIEV